MKKLFYILGFLLVYHSCLTAQDNRMLFKGVPIIKITMLDGKAETDINKDIKLNASVVISNASGSNFSSAQLFSGYMTIKGRGNYTWTLPKRPYNIVTCDASFKKKNVELLGMPAESSWCLLADYEDRTALRTQFSSAISYAFGLPWCSRAQKVELYINNEYRGLYTLCEKVERGLNRINVAELKISDNSGDALTGGYTIEQQADYQIGANEVSFQDSWGRFFSYKLPESDKVTPAQNNYIKNYWNSFLDKVMNQPLEDTVNGYRSVINPLSFARYMLLEDLAKNGDTYYNSWYTTKDRLKKLDAGPGWDWGICWGNVNRDFLLNIMLTKANDTYVPVICPYYNKMMQDAYYSNLVKKVFDDSKAKINQVITDCEAYYPKLVLSGAISRDSAKWPNIFNDTSFWNYFPTYQEYVDSFLSFVRQRTYFQERKIYGLQAAKPIHTDLP